MLTRFYLIAAGAALLAVVPAAAQPRARRAIPRNAAGHPDFQGNWTNATITPIERPAGRGPVLTAQEIATMEKRRRNLLDSLSQKSDPDRPAPPKGGVKLGDPQFDAASGGTGGYNVFFIDGGDQVAVINGEARSSLITRPSN